MSSISKPDYVEARIGLASILLDEGNPEPAAELVRAGLAVSPGDARLHCTLGLALLDIGDLSAAREAFDRALELDPGLSEARVNRAIVAYEQGQYRAAADDLTIALEGDERNPDLLYNRGFAHEAAGHLDEAIADYTRALQDPRADQAQLLYQRGLCLATLERFCDARDDLQAHLALGSSPHEQEIKSCPGRLQRPGWPARPAADLIRWRASWLSARQHSGTRWPAWRRRSR
jgi:tetratricopeptide (TPR) repeat protein